MTLEEVSIAPEAANDVSNPNSSTSSFAIPVIASEPEADELTAEKPKAATFEPLLSSTAQPQSGRCKRRYLIIVGTIIVVTLVIILSVVITGSERCCIDPFPTVTVDFTTGVSIISNYAVETKVRSRLATTNLTMEVLNGMNCSSVHMVTLQLPLNARVTSLKTMADDGCTTNGQVKEIQEARDTFADQTSQGLSSAYVEAQDGFTYTVQVSIPPYGKTKVELMVEQLLQQRRGEIAFEVPLIPNEEVDSLIFDMSAEDIQGNPVGFELDLDLPDISSIVNATNGTSNFHINLPDARQHNLPHVLRGRYAPGQVPENGLLYFDGECFEHYFLPPSLKHMPRNFVFLVDVSDSMRHDNKKFNMTRTALKKFINTIDVQDSFSIQTFGPEGTIDLWGPNTGTEDEKDGAKKFLDSLKPKGDEYWYSWGTNLHAAILEALLRAKDDIKNSKNDTVSILVIVSDGWATAGETDRSKIVNDVYGLNKDGSVKIFTLGFHDNADMTLLDVISLLNGGISATISQAEEDFESQMTRFLESEIGSVLLSDMNIQFTGDQMKVVGQTETRFPLLAGGYEVVVRGLVEGSSGGNPLKAVTTASTLDDVRNWVTIATDSPNTATPSLCYQSYAHARVTQLVRLRDAAGFLEDNIIKSLVNLVDPNCREEKFAKCIEKEALNLAIDAKIVAKGLTAMVTVDADECMKIDDSVEVCLDGTTADSAVWDMDMGYPSMDMSGSVVSVISLLVSLVALVAALLIV